jgi:hypothetical protein
MQDMMCEWQFEERPKNQPQSHFHPSRERKEYYSRIDLSARSTTVPDVEKFFAIE